MWKLHLPCDRLGLISHNWWYLSHISNWNSEILQLRGLLDDMSKHTHLHGRWIPLHHGTGTFIGNYFWNCRPVLAQLSHSVPLISSDQGTGTLYWSPFTFTLWSESYLIHLGAYTVPQTDILHITLLPAFPKNNNYWPVTYHCGQGI